MQRNQMGFEGSVLVAKRTRLRFLKSKIGGFQSPLRFYIKLGFRIQVAFLNGPDAPRSKILNPANFAFTVARTAERNFFFFFFFC